MKIIIALVVVIIVAAVGFWVWKSNSGATTSPDQMMQLQTSQPESTTNKASADITAQSFAFSPSTITVKAGATVSFANLDSVDHSVTSDTSGQFDTGLVGQNEKATFTAPNSVGSYPFHCSLHPNMEGTLVVQ